MQNIDTKDPEIEALIVTLKNSEFNFDSKLIIDVRNQSGRAVLSIYPKDKYIRFYDAFIQNGINLPGMKAFLNSNPEWSSNHR
jgi:hypothetical protein